MSIERMTRASEQEQHAELRWVDHDGTLEVFRASGELTYLFILDGDAAHSVLLGDIEHLPKFVESVEEWARDIRRKFNL